MTTQTIRKDRGLLDPRRAAGHSATRGSAPIRDFLREAGETLRGAFEAPLRQSREAQKYKSVASLDAATRRDIGL